jgi:enoyl-CoA hydratase
MTAGLRIDDATPRVRIITLDRPQRLNALDGPTLEALQAAVRECDDPALDKRAIVLRGAGRAFCAGSDLKWLADSGVIDDPAAHLRHQDRMAAAFEAIETSRCVVIAAVQGYAVAGGLELALACDLIVAADDAQLGDEHIRKNLLPSGGSSQRLPRRIGLSRAMYYLVSGRRMSGAQAERIGLACMAVPAARLDDASLHLAGDIAQADAHALAAMKAMARKAMELPLKDGLQFERWQQFRYRNESPALLHSVRRFAAGDRPGAAAPRHDEDTR